MGSSCDYQRHIWIHSTLCCDTLLYNNPWEAFLNHNSTEYVLYELQMLWKDSCTDTVNSIENNRHQMVLLPMSMDIFRQRHTIQYNTIPTEHAFHFCLLSPSSAPVLNQVLTHITAEYQALIFYILYGYFVSWNLKRSKVNVTNAYYK